MTKIETYTITAPLCGCEPTLFKTVDGRFVQCKNGWDDPHNRIKNRTVWCRRHGWVKQ